MSKKSQPRRLENNEAMAQASNLRISPRKLNLVAQLIRGLSVEQALRQLTFSKRPIARDVKKLLLSAVANAENNHGLDVDSLFVNQAFVGKGLVMKRWNPRARGRIFRIEKPFSNITIILKEREELA